MNKTIVLRKTGETIMEDFKIPELQFEAVKTPYTLELFENGAESYNPEVFKGFTYTEDVNFVFKSTEKDVVFQLFLDEMNEGYFTIGNSETSYFFCN